MILVNTDYISGKELEMLSLVKGSTIQSIPAPANEELVALITKKVLEALGK